MPQEYIDEIRRRFPEYDDLSDQELASRLLERCPDYEPVLGDVARSRAGLPDSSPLGLRKLELAAVRGTACAGPKFDRRDVRQTAVRTPVVVVIAPRLECALKVLKAEKPM